MTTINVVIDEFHIDVETQEQGPAGISMVWRGVYSALTTYVMNDAVSYLGSSYICILTSTNNLPTNATYWNVVASKGDTGPNTVSTTTTTDIVGLIKGVGGFIAQAVADTDYLTPGTAASTYVPVTRTVNGHALSSNVTVSKSDVGLGNADNTSDANKPISSATQTALDTKVDENSSITGATKTKVTYDAKGLVTSGTDATTADIADSSNRRYVTDAESTVIDNTSGTNTGDQTATTVGVTPSGNLGSTNVQAALQEHQGDIDSINTSLGGLTDAVVLKGTWDASAGTFPGSGAAQAGWTYIVSTGGTVDGTIFAQNDRLLAIVDNASATVFAANWFKLDYTDLVLSVAGKTGAVTLDAADISETAGLKIMTSAERTKLSGIETAADVTDAGNVGSSIHGSTAKTTPVDADTIAGIDSAASNVLTRFTWANIKATLKTYFDTLYATVAQVHYVGTTAIAANRASAAQALTGITSIDGQAATVVTNANLTGHVTSVGNAAILGSFTVAQLNTAISDADVATGGGTATGTNTGDQTASTVSVTPAGNLGSTTAQAALQELQGDIDTINSSLGGLTDAVVLKGSWDASAGTFPGSGAAQAGWTYIVSVLGTVDGTAFAVGDRLLAIVDNASATTFAANWFKLDYTDNVLSVAGRTGAVTLTTADVAASTDKNYVTDAQAVVVGNTSGTNTGDETAARIATINHGTSAKTSLVDADEITGQDSAASFGLIRTTWTNVKVFLKTYFDTLYATISQVHYVGTTSIAANRASAAQALTGITSIDGNAATVTTNANLTGHVTSTGNATVLGSFTIAQLNAAVSDADVTTIAAVETLTNKRITKRIATIASSGTPTINTDTTDMFTITAQAAAITDFSTNNTGTPTTGQTLVIRIKDDGTARAITWGAKYAARGVSLPTTTVLGKYLYVGFIWNEVATIWDCIASSQEA